MERKEAYSGGFFRACLQSSIRGLYRVHCYGKSMDTPPASQSLLATSTFGRTGMKANIASGSAEIRGLYKYISSRMCNVMSDVPEKQVFPWEEDTYLRAGPENSC